LNFRLKVLQNELLDVIQEEQVGSARYAHIQYTYKLDFGDYALGMNTRPNIPN